MKTPSIHRLCQTFATLEPWQALLIKKIAAAADSADTLRELVEQWCPETAGYARSCYHDPYTSQMWRNTIALHAIDVVMGTHGVEALPTRDDGAMGAPSFEYLNAGDTYATTLIFYRDQDALKIGTWGDIVENYPDDFE